MKTGSLLHLLLVLFPSVLFYSCKTSIKADKPEEAYAVKKPVFEREVSFMQIPMEIALKDIQSQINRYVAGTLYEDKSFDDNEGDGLICTVKKYSDIKVEGLGNKIRVTVPLDVWGKYKMLGIVTEFKGILSATYVSAINLKDNWKVETITRSSGHEWIRKPTIDLYLFELPVTAIADAAIRGQQAYIESEIDKAVIEFVDLKEHLSTVIKSLYEPILLSETYKTWFRIEPLEFYTSQINTMKGIMNISLGLKAYTETFIGPKPPSVDTSFFPQMRVMDKMPEEFSVGLVSFVKYEDAAQLLREQFVDNPYTYTEGKRSITLTHIDLWGKQEKIVVEVGMKGSINGMIYLEGVPAYDSVSRNIVMKNLDFHIDSRNKLLKSANWLLHGRFARVMEKNMYFEMGKQLEEAKKETQSYLNNYELSKGVFLKGNLSSLEASGVYLSPEAIISVVNATGKMMVKVEGL